MTLKPTNKKAEKPTDAVTKVEKKPDGRRLRAVRSREKIVLALMSLVHRGIYEPTALQIANEADVSLRTVFRHIDDMDSLYRDISQRLLADVMPFALAPYHTETLTERVDEIAERRATIFEHLMPIRTSANVRRFRSEFLAEDYAKLVQLERQRLQDALPDQMLGDPIRANALELAASFQTWTRLRQDQGQSPEEALLTMKFMLQQLVS